MSPAPERTPERKRRVGALAGLLLLLLVGSIAAIALLKRKEIHDQTAQLNRSEESGRSVDIAQVKRSEPGKPIVLVGETRPYYSVTLFARVSGYLRGPIADIGDKVEEGAVLAQVESPESELAYNSARADALNKGRIAGRMRKLLAQKLVSAQEAEQAFAASEIADATLRTQEVIRGYQAIRAPFRGRITQRFVDPGALIQNASSSQSASQPLYILSQTDSIRVFAYVSQQDAPYIKPGIPIRIEVPSQPGEALDARIERVAGELDPKTRTLLTETIVENPDGRIAPGSFVRVQLKIENAPFLELPSSALVMKGSDAFVPTVQKDDRIHYAKVDLVDNDGTRLLIRSGLEVGQRVAVNIGNTLVEGTKVKAPRAESAAQAAPKGN